MRRDKNTFRHDSLQDAKTISKVMDSITEGLAKGKLIFSDEDDKIVLSPDGLLELKVTASQEDNRQKINVRISWQVESKTKNSKSNLKVSS